MALQILLGCNSWCSLSFGTLGKTEGSCSPAVSGEPEVADCGKQEWETEVSSPPVPAMDVDGF